MAGPGEEVTAGNGSTGKWGSLAEVSTALAEATQDLAAVLDLVARLAVELVGDGCVVLLASEDDVALVPAAAHHRRSYDCVITPSYRPMPRHHPASG